MAANDEIARDLTLAVVEAVGVIDTSGDRQSINRHRAREVGKMYRLIYEAVSDAKRQVEVKTSEAAN
jgi:hypothetical protein